MCKVYNKSLCWTAVKKKDWDNIEYNKSSLTVFVKPSLKQKAAVQNCMGNLDLHTGQVYICVYDRFGDFFVDNLRLDANGWNICATLCPNFLSYPVLHRIQTSWVYPAIRRTQCNKFLEQKEIILTDSFSIKEWLSVMLSKYSLEEIRQAQRSGSFRILSWESPAC